MYRHPHSHCVGLLALSPTIKNPYLAFPTASTWDNPSALDNPDSNCDNRSALGKVILFDTESLNGVCTIFAHHSPLSCMSINHDGTLLSTASERGTIIRVWGVPSGQRLYQFRRGSREAEITFMSFNLSSTILAVSSAHITIHFFKLEPVSPPESPNTEKNDSLASSP